MFCLNVISHVLFMSKQDIASLLVVLLFSVIIKDIDLLFSVIIKDVDRTRNKF